MAVRLTLQVPGDRLAQLDRSFSRMSAHVKDWRVPFTAIRDDLYDIESEQFDTEGRRSTAWAPLKDSYAARKAKRGGFKPMLVATSRLRDALTKPGGDNVSVIKTDEFRFGVRDGAVPYGKYHQSGTLGHFERRTRSDRLSGHPRRRPMELTEKDKIVIITRMRRHAFGLGQAGLIPGRALGRSR